MKKTTETGKGERKPGPLDRFLSAGSLILRVPLPAPRFDASRLDFWLPVVGLPVALASGFVLSLSAFLSGSADLAAVLCLLVQYLGANLFHFDGLLDTADAFLGPVSREKRQAILKDSRIGSFALFAGTLYLIAKFLLVRTLAERLGGLCLDPLAFLVLAFPVTGRFAASLLPALFLPAKKEGLGVLASGSKWFRSLSGTMVALIPFIAYAFYLCALPPASSLSRTVALLAVPLLVAAPLSSLFVGMVYRRGLGGYTGDALGASVELAELLHLALALAILNA